MKDLEISKYFNRIGLDNCDNTLQGLTILQQSHIMNIPFENLDVVVGRKIELNTKSLFNKIIENKRGGYCFELNLLYAELLKSLGFSPEPVLGRVWLRNPEKTPPRNHLAHLVNIDGETYVTDVGFGGLTTRIPLNINNTSQINDNDGEVRVVPIAVNEFMIQRLTENGWANQYSFEKTNISKEDIDISNYYMSTNPKSHFYRDKSIGKFTNDGRIGLFNNAMSTRKGVVVVNKKEISYGNEWLEILRKDFNLNLDFSKTEMDILFQKE